MTETIAAESGTELFRGAEDDEVGWDIAFGPVATGDQPFWSLFRLRRGVPVERMVLATPRPTRGRLRAWLVETAGESSARHLLARVGRLQHFYAGYYAARPDLARRHLSAVA